jgi:cyanophycinase-like exopeptidase
VTAKSRPGAVYLAASSQEKTLRAMASRVLASVERRPLRVAATFAAAGGPMIERVGHSVGRLFEGADVHRFTVSGEGSGAPAMEAAEAAAIVEGADLIFVGGGDPVQGARRLARAGADAWLRDAHARGTACLGISAGAIMLCAWWAEWPDDPPPGARHDGGELVRCAGVVPDLVVDCHAEDDDWNELRLVRAMLRAQRPRDGAADVAPPPLPRFVGLPTGTGIVVSRDGSAVDIGGSSVPLRVGDGDGSR